MTRAVTNTAFDLGAAANTLQASVMGDPIYRRMGYEEVYRYRGHVRVLMERSELATLRFRGAGPYVSGREQGATTFRAFGCSNQVVETYTWKWVLAIAAMLFAFVLTIAVDRIASLVVPRREALVFPPGSRFRLKTSEFDFEANVNSLGFRDRPFHAGSSSVTRVVAIGDSFTYGWGVQDSEPWPKVLERDLRARGMAVEIANLGRPGAGPDQYLRIAQAAVPVLKPRWIIVGLLQGDDLNQSRPSHAAPAERPILRIVYPTLSQIFSESPVVTANETRKKWQRQARALVAGLKPAERERFESIDPAVRTRFLRGDLNPDILALSTRTPQYSSWLLDESGDVVRRKITAMAEQLARIRRLAEGYGARLLVVSVPNWPYVSQSRSRQRLGFVLTREMLSTKAPDDEMRQACREAGIDRFISVTDEIRRRAADGAALYFPADGHFTPEGHQAFADELSARVWLILSNQRTRALERGERSGRRAHLPT